MPLDPDSQETVALGAMPSTPRPKPRGGGETRFEPGTLVARRYRIISRLGGGGMGEVFRADDIVLGQQVALKFLPEAAVHNVNLLARFYDEVRIARQIAHPNVCRVYDIGELDGHPYLSMEYIDGEDLASLLRRIGRLPGDKAAEFARKICAGVAAAHAQGVLHRDIKPGNIMIDGRGEPRVTDFGLAALASGIAGTEIRNGTPAYMAPEQLEGREVSAQSDIYALGLVFHEMFTGKAPHEVTTLEELTRRRSESTTNPSTLVPDLDPAANRTIQACLQPDPRRRPNSALDVARMLPGGDPLAMALEAGQTPSPEMVADSGSSDCFRPLVIGGAIVAAAVLFGISLWLTSGFQLAHLTLLEQPEVLESKARDLIHTLGYPGLPADSATGFEYDVLQRNYQWDRFSSNKEAWISLLQTSPSPIRFWYRRSPGPLVAQNVGSAGRVRVNDPPVIIAGMVSAEVAMDGRLLAFLAVPPERQEVSEQTYDWSPLLAAAKLNAANLTPVTPERTPSVNTDQRAAWTGRYPDKDYDVRVEAGAFQGKPVYFTIIWPWTKLERTVTAAGAIASRRTRTQSIFGLVKMLLVLTAAVLACVNAKAGRVDLRGANRLAIFMVAANMLVWLLGAHHVDAVAEETLWLTALADAIGTGVLAWGMYLALEPWIRRYWPQALVTWSRVMAGRWQDPLVGRDIVVALVVGTISTAYLCMVTSFDTISMGEFQVQELLGARQILRVIAADLAGVISTMLLYFMLLFLLRLLTRNTWRASAAFVVLWCVNHGMASGANDWWVSGLLSVPLTLLFLVLLNRFGFLATVLASFVSDVFVDLIMTANLSAWYGQSTVIAVLMFVAVAAYGFKLAIGDGSLFDMSPAKAAQGYNR